MFFCFCKSPIFVLMFKIQNISEKSKKRLFYLNIIFFFFYAGVFYLIFQIGNEGAPPKPFALFQAAYISFFLTFWAYFLEKLKSKVALRLFLWILCSVLYVGVSSILIDKELTIMRIAAYSWILLINAIYFYRPEIVGLFSKKKISVE